MNAVLRFLEGLRAETLECCANAVSSHAFDTRGGKSLQFSWAVLQPTMLLAKHGELRVFFLSFFFFYDVLETNLSFFEARSCRFTRWRILWILCRRVLLATFYKNRIFFFCFFFLFESQENSIRGINNAVKISISFVYANLLSRVASSSHK